MYDDIRDNIFTPESDDDTDGGDRLGYTYFYGHELTPADTLALIETLQAHHDAAVQASQLPVCAGCGRPPSAGNGYCEDYYADCPACQDGEAHPHYDATGDYFPRETAS